MAMTADALSCLLYICISSISAGNLIVDGDPALAGGRDIVGDRTVNLFIFLW